MEIQADKGVIVVPELPNRVLESASGAHRLMPTGEFRRGGDQEWYYDPEFHCGFLNPKDDQPHWILVEIPNRDALLRERIVRYSTSEESTGPLIRDITKLFKQFPVQPGEGE